MPSTLVRALVTSSLLTSLVCAAGCASGGGDFRADSGAGGRVDAGSAIDAGTPRDGAVPTSDAGAAIDGGGALVDAGVPSDAGSGTAIDAGRDAGGSTGAPLDPSLDVPPAGNEPCATPGSLGECPGISVCRFFDRDEGRCESCTECGNLGAPCTRGEDCDILFACYAGRCTNICPLGTSYCGPPEDCLDVGHPTYGVCRP